MLGLTASVLGVVPKFRCFFDWKASLSADNSVNIGDNRNWKEDLCSNVEKTRKKIDVNRNNNDKLKCVRVSIKTNRLGEVDRSVRQQSVYDKDDV